MRRMCSGPPTPSSAQHALYILQGLDAAIGFIGPSRFTA